MIRKPKTVLFVVLILTIVALIIDLPSVPVKFSLGPLKIDTVIAPPKLNFNLAGAAIKRDFDVKLGLDLKGGTSLTLLADMSEISPEEKDEALEAAKEVIERRV